MTSIVNQKSKKFVPKVAQKQKTDTLFDRIKPESKPQKKPIVNKNVKPKTVVKSVNKTTKTKQKSILSESKNGHTHTPSNITPRPLQLTTGYYDWHGDFIPPGVLKAPFSNKPFNINEKLGLDQFLKHLLDEFKLVIADLKKIADFTQYMHYWADRFNSTMETLPIPSVENTLALYCTPIQTNPYNPKAGKGDASNCKAFEKVTYYLLSDSCEEDKLLRDSLQISRLEYVLSQQEIERHDHTFTGKCFFCKYRVTKGNRSDLILHMTQCHKFQIGHPDNIVFANEFISKIKIYFDDNTCPYCTKKYKEKSVLLDHMKRKNHRRLDPKNFDFDKFYVINYLESGKHWSELQEEIKNQEQIEHELKRANRLKIEAEMQNKIKLAGVKLIDSKVDGNLNANATVFVPKSNKNSPTSVKKQFLQNDSLESEPDTDNEEEWLEKPDYSNQCFKCLFSESYFTTAEECIQFMQTSYNFDLNAYSCSTQYSFYDILKIINYTRSETANSKPFDKIVQEIESKNWDDIKYMFPTFEDDQLLYSFEAKKNNIDNWENEDAVIQNIVIVEDQCDPEIIRSTSILKDLVLND